MTLGPRVTIVGAGTMGHAIAYVAALAGCPVALTDTDPRALRDARPRVDRLVAEGLKRGTLVESDRAAVHTRLRPESSLAESLRDAEIVVEAVPENLTVKQRVFADLERLAPPGTILGTNTSSLPVGQIAAAVREPGRVIGIHFFPPVPVVRLVEVVTHARSETRTAERAAAFARLLGKEPVVVRDSPGFVSSRLAVVLALEAMRMLEQDVATAEDIDRAMELGYHHPLGPLRLSDLMGLDVHLAIADQMYQQLNLPQHEPPRILRDKVARGELGRKMGKGFYVWSD